MNEYNIKVDFTKGRIVTNLKRLVQNDYNSTKINFTFDKEGRVLFKMLYPDGSEYIDEVQNNELIFGKGILYQEGTYEYEISLYSEDGRLTDYATKSFEVRSELVDTDEVVAPDDRVPILDTLINEVNTIKQDVADGKYDGQDGITPTIGGNGNWFIGNTDTGLPSRGEKGDAGSVKFIVVTELPTENIDESAIYMMPEENPESPTNEKNMYQEFIYVNGTWESLGTASVQVDLTNYPTKEEVKAITGELENLPTEDKSNIVNSIIELAGNSGGIPTITEDVELTEYGIYNVKAPTAGVRVYRKGAKNTDDTKGFLLKGDGALIYTHFNSNNTSPGALIYFCENKINYHYGDSSTVSKTITGLMTTIDRANVNAVYTYKLLPVTDLTPTKDTHFVNKKYVDDAIASLKAELSGS